MAANTRATKTFFGFADPKNDRLYKWLAIPFSIFCLLRLPNIAIERFYCGHQTPGLSGMPGECHHWLEFDRLGWGMFGHLAFALPAGALAALQFTPYLRTNYRQAHRLVGYIATICAFGGIFSAFLILDKSFGGETETVFAGFVMGGAAAYSLYRSVSEARAKRISSHRAWMLRGWMYLGSILTMRFFMPMLALFVSVVPLYGQHTTIPCDVITTIFEKDVDQVYAAYPLCDPLNAALNPTGRAIVKADFTSELGSEQEAAFRVTFGTAWWIAIVLHAVAIEIYLGQEHKAAKQIKDMKMNRNIKAGVDGTGVADPTAKKAL